MAKDIVNVTVALHFVKMGQNTKGEHETLFNLELII
jgi:hypothetical protein